MSSPCLTRSSHFFFSTALSKALDQFQLYETARQQFALETGTTITTENYIDVMALNAKKFSIAPNTLATALCRLLAHVMEQAPD